MSGKWCKANPEKMKEYRHDWYVRNKEKQKELSLAWTERQSENYRTETTKAWRKRNPMKDKATAKRYQLKRKCREYGITLDIYNAWAAIGVCKICSRPFEGYNEPHLDHCHVSGKARGLLCSRCNLALGMVKDDVRVLAAMITYLGK